MTIGTFVRYKIPVSETEALGYRAVGRVSAVENYTDEHGVRTWIYVRFVNADGTPQREVTRCVPAELEPA